MAEDNDFPNLTTTRLHLREIVRTDAESLFAIHGDVEHMRWFGTEAMKTLDDAAKLVDIFSGWRKNTDSGTRWGIARQSDGMFLGTCGLFKWNKNWHSCTIGYELSAKEQGHGYMTEALRAILAYGFEKMNLNRIEALVSPENARSINILTNLGFLNEGRSQEAGYWAGQYHDLLQHALLRRNYKE